MVEGVHFGESVCIVALGIDQQETKHPLAPVEGSTENATVVCDLLVGLHDRGLDVIRPNRHRRGHGAVPGRGRRLRLPGDPALPAAQDPQPGRPAARAAARTGREEDARGPPRRLRPAGRGPDGRAGPGTGQDPPEGGGQPARGHGRDPHRAAPGRAPVTAGSSGSSRAHISSSSTGSRVIHPPSRSDRTRYWRHARAVHV